jgi:carbon-monoxide dehydrogenase small subunit
MVRGCLMLAVQAQGSEVWTVEGLTETGAISAIQDAFVARNALQCGFCTPGMLVAAATLLKQNPSPTRDERRPRTLFHSAADQRNAPGSRSPGNTPA